MHNEYVEQHSRLLNVFADTAVDHHEAFYEYSEIGAATVSLANALSVS